jgi:hypothetical protein
MQEMTDPKPDHPAPASGDGPPDAVARRLAEPPSARYAQGGPIARKADRARWASSRPILQAVLIAAVGAGLLFLLAGLLSTTVGLLFIAAAMGAGVGLTLAGLAVAGPENDGAGSAPLPRAAVRRAALLLAVGAVALAAIATWLFARSEGGALGIVDYLWSTFGLLVPAEGVLAAVGAAWGAGAGPVSSS